MFDVCWPQVLHEIVQSGGKNLVSGMEHLVRDLQAGQMKMTDTDAFAPNVLGRDFTAQEPNTNFYKQVLGIFRKNLNLCQINKNSQM